MDGMRISVAEIITIVLAIVAIATFCLAVMRDRRAEQSRQSGASAAAARSDAKLDAMAADVRSTKGSVDRLYGKIDAMKDDMRGLDTRLAKVETTCGGHEQRICNLEERTHQ